MIMWCQRLVKAITNKAISSGSAVITTLSIDIPVVVIKKNVSINNIIV